MNSFTNAPIDARQLRAFAALAHTGSFTLAAKELFLTQSAVSHSMRALEEEVGCRLLDRMGKKVVLTQAGEALLQHAEKILREMNVARESLGQLGKWGHRRLRLGASATACQYVLPNVIRAFKKQYPQCVISIEPCDTEEAIELLDSRVIDLSVSMQPMRMERVDFIPLFQDEMQFILSPNHRWAVKRQVERTEIPKEHYILYAKKSYTFRLIESYFAQEDVVLNGVMELGSVDAIKELVKLELGVSILSPWVALRELEDQSLVAMPLGRRKLRRHWGILYSKARRLSMTEETFVTLCREACQKMGRGTVEVEAEPPTVAQTGS